MAKFNRDYFWVLLCVTAATAEPIFIKYGYSGDIDPWQLLVVRNVVAALVIVPLTRSFKILPWKDMGRIASVGLFLLITTVLKLLALVHITAITCITITTATPAIVALINRALGRDRLTWQFWLGFFMCLLGVLMTVDIWHAAEFGQGDWLGLALIGLSVVSTTCYRVRLEGATEVYSPRLLSTYIFLINGLVSLLAVGPMVSMPSLGSWCWWLGGLIGILAALANVAFVWAVSRIGATNMSMFNLIQRPLVVVFAACFLHEPLNVWQILGICLVFAGLPLSKVRRQKLVTAEADTAKL